MTKYQLPKHWYTHPTQDLLLYRNDAADADDWEAVDEIDDEITKRDMNMG